MCRGATLSPEVAFVALAPVDIEVAAAVVDDAVAHDEQGKSNGDVCVVIAAAASLGVVARAEGTCHGINSNNSSMMRRRRRIQ